MSGRLPKTTLLAAILVLTGNDLVPAQPPLAFPPQVPANNPLQPASHIAAPRGSMPFYLLAPTQPRQPLPPLLYVRFAGPKGMKITFFRNGPKGQTFDTPVTVGMRPGYRYRMQVTGMPDFPDIVLTPTIEVSGTLLLANRRLAAQFPVGITFDKDDFEAVEAGSVMTKVAALERPDVAIPRAATADQPIQFTLPPGRDLREEAKQHGRPVLTLQFGPKRETPQEMARQTINGTLLLPNEVALGPPAYPPAIHYSCIPLFDPLAGPRDPNEEMKLYDGGDGDRPIGFGANGKLVGVDPADTVAEFVDSQGRKHITISNKVGCCVPRFIIMRGTSQQAGEQSSITLVNSRTSWGSEVALATLAPDAQHQNIKIEGVDGRERPSGTQGSYTTGVVARIEGLAVTGVIKHPARVNGTSANPPPPEPLDRPLKIDKWPDKCNVTQGGIITFTIKYSNFGGNPIQNIVIADSLVGRFEYVPGSAKTDREAAFTTNPNDAGSLTLRWEITDPLPPRSFGLVSFQVRVR
jgi:uncharacterized repeat protein (TIGR01451 family)